MWHRREGRFISVSLDFPPSFLCVSLWSHEASLLELEATGLWWSMCVSVLGVCACVCVCLGTLCSPSSLLQWYFPAKRFVCLFGFFFHFIAGHDYNEGDDDKAFIIRCSAVSNPEALILNYSLYVFCSRLFWIGGLCVCVCVNHCEFFFSFFDGSFVVKLQYLSHMSLQYLHPQLVSALSHCLDPF